MTASQAGALLEAYKGGKYISVVFFKCYNMM